MQTYAHEFFSALQPAFAHWQPYACCTHCKILVHALSLRATGRPLPGRAWLPGAHPSRERTGRSQSSQHAAATAWRCYKPRQPHMRIHNLLPRFSPSQNLSSQNLGACSPARTKRRWSRALRHPQEAAARQPANSSLIPQKPPSQVATRSKHWQPRAARRLRSGSRAAHPSPRRTLTAGSY